MSKKYPEGSYRAKVRDSQLGFAKSGSEQIAIVFELLDTDWAGKTITYYGSFHPNAEEYTMQALAACGFSGDFTNLMSLQRNEVSLEIRDRKNKDGTVSEYSEVKFVNGPHKAKLTAPMSEEQIRAFQARMKAKGTVVPALASAPAKPVDDSNIPF